MKTKCALLLGGALLLASLAQAMDTPLYDADGNPVAYVTDDSTIYLWKGDPVAYISEKDKKSIYGFDGWHRGWLIDRIVRGHDGDMIGFEQGAVVNKGIAPLTPLKGIKGLKPYKLSEEPAPLEPYASQLWSHESLLSLLAGDIQ